MSTIIMQVGQCGNQLGIEWWKLIDNCQSQGRDNRRFSHSNIVLAQGGRGNNWAYGYNGHWGHESNGLLHRSMEAVRRAAEKLDYYGGVLLFHSLGGGTGSGLGSKLCEEVCDAFPAGHILTVSVSPHQTGESPMQNYNCLLSLSALQRSVDGVLLFENDKALTFAQKPLMIRSTKSAGTLAVMNSHIVSCIGGLLLPVQSITHTSGLSLGSEPWELIRSLCPIPAAKFLHTSQAHSSTKTQWDLFASSTLQVLPQPPSTGNSYNSRAVLAVVRGNKDNSFLLSGALIKLRKGHNCVSWNPFPIDHWTDPTNRLGDSSTSQLLTVCSNHSSVSNLLGHVQRSKEMLQARAYIHLYQRYGLKTLDFNLALETCSAIVNEYGCN